MKRDDAGVKNKIFTPKGENQRGRRNDGSLEIKRVPEEIESEKRGESSGRLFAWGVVGGENRALVGVVTYVTLGGRMSRRREITGGLEEGRRGRR
ncbi:hypothetical protein Tco_1310516 [Tanacetum coccineum]